MLVIYYGAMKSGKSEELIRVINNYKYEMSSKKLFICKPKLDDRDNKSGLISSRNGGSVVCDWTWENNLELLDFPPEAYKADAIFIDEAQFLTPFLVSRLRALIKAKHIYCTGLRTDFKGNVFKPMAELLAVACHIREVRSLCQCGAKATKNQRIDANGEAVTDGDQVVIGNNYVARCINCFKGDL